MAKPLSAELEAYILAEVARKRIVVRAMAKAPSITDAFVTDKGEWYIYVWSGASARTIWSSPKMNHTFRAWHDSTHLETGLGLDPASELALAERTCAEARARGLSEEATAVLYAETAGQIEYYTRHGNTFPENQRAFVKAFLSGEWLKGGKY